MLCLQRVQLTTNASSHWGAKLTVDAEEFTQTFSPTETAVESRMVGGGQWGDVRWLSVQQDAYLELGRT